MTVKVKLTKAIGGHKKHDTIEVTQGVSTQLIASGHAEEVKAESKPRRKTQGEPPPAENPHTAG